MRSKIGHANPSSGRSASLARLTGTGTGTLLLLLVATSPLACPKPNTPSDWPDDPKTEEEALAACKAADARLNALQCRAARKDFVEFCTYELGQGIPLHPQCIAKIAICSDVEKC
jgi:hypothetical protein